MDIKDNHLFENSSLADLRSVGVPRAKVHTSWSMWKRHESAQSHQSLFCSHILSWAVSWQNQQNGMCVKRRLRSSWAFAQSVQILRCSHDESLGPQLPIERTAKTDQTGRMPRLIWVFAGRTVILLVLSCRGSNRARWIFRQSTLFPSTFSSIAIELISHLISKVTGKYFTRFTRLTGCRYNR